MPRQRADLDEVRRRERLLADLLRLASAATREMPTARCWSASGLKAAIRQIREQMENPPRTSDDGLLTFLQEIRLLHAVAVKPPRGSRSFPRFYVLDIQAGEDEPTVDPLELLQAQHADGVICYFSALVLHGLTSQPPSSHHLALPQPRKASTNAPTPPAEGGAQGAERGRSDRNPLGTLVFTYDDLPYFTSRRSFPLTDVQTRYVNPRTIVRSTTVEQTLIDTLHRPQRCGGPEVVFEAWERGLSLLDEGALASCLRVTTSLILVRRVGAMLAFLSHGTRSTELRDVLVPEASDDEPAIALLPGIQYGRLDPIWRVLVP